MDIAIAWDPVAGRGDWSIVSGDLALGDSLASAVLVSLFTDRVAADQPTSADTAIGISASSGPAGSIAADRGGWWGDAFADVPIGSRLWQLRRAVKSGDAAIPAEVQAIVSEALQWLIDDGVASSIAVDAWWSVANRQSVEFRVSVIEPGHSNSRVFQFSWAWKEIS
ncbi:bacteriophage protein [Gluconacetobacter sacchari DSM 12717]|uniref:Bacteriophage protein GP46 n=2 Tax=Gluconacetobacter sacchari TaxID=92759 RepID=A0A7W4NR40_9PROT|nr:phage GP46 family protein [Gluconacetobacter sacchari]MBB2159735.1 hypothetical protein [Gluconacetobacter sacchari]GBQ23169.1 bacteriophage protein [Gluconacetobacter sacchari DSM 12717]